jgi:predicted methyltransferase
MKYFLKYAFICMLFLLSGTTVTAQDFDITKQKIEEALANNSRPEADVARDNNRLPVDTLEFFGFRHDMRVLELIPGGGWYTRVLAPVLRDEGELFVALGTDRIEKNILGSKGFDRVKVLAKEAKLFRPEGSRYYQLENAVIDVRDVDMVLTFRNYHNFDTAGRVAMNEAVYKSLKPGGIYGVVDHTRRHMEGETFENRRRFDPVKAIKEIQAAGFELVDFTDLHYRADDELRYEVGRKTVSGNTDRWTLKFRKVER